MIDSNIIEVFNSDNDGFSKILDIENCIIGIIKGCESITEKNQKKTERHLDTEEIFIPIAGKSSLYVGEERYKVELEIGKVYNVKKGVWHSFVSDIDALVVVVEKKGTGEKNSEYRFKK